jgi:hypothetical protein
MATAKLTKNSRKEATHTLIIWENSPENTRLLLIPNEKITEEVLGYLVMANSHYVNEVKCDENTGLMALYNWLFDTDGNLRYPEYELNIQDGKLVLENGHITRVCHTGWLM